jgi:CheY-like chemotaxis protein
MRRMDCPCAKTIPTWFLCLIAMQRYLSGTNGFQNRAEHPCPQILLLDLKMPKSDGFNVLEWLRKNPPLIRLRVIVFSSANHHSDIDRAYDLGASSFFRKPTALQDMRLIVDGLKQWLEINQFSVLSDMSFSGSNSRN